MVLIVDLLIIGYLLYKMFYCSKKGFLYTAVQLVGTLATWGISWFYSPILAKMIYEKTTRGFLLERLQENADYLITKNLEEFILSIQAFFDDLPPMISGLFKGEAEQYSRAYFSSLDPAYLDSAVMTEGIMEGLIDPLALGIFRSIAFVGLFLMLALVVRLVLPLFKGFNHIPLIGGVNSFLGAIAGIGIGLIYVYIASGVVWILATFVGDIWPMVSFDTIEKTILLRLFVDHLPWISG